MSAAEKPPFDPHALAEWLVEGLKDTLAYRLHQTFDPEKWVDYLREKIPTRNGALHYALKPLFEKAGFKFEDLHHGDAKFYVVRKKFRETPAGQTTVRRLVLIPGFGDSPASWMPSFSFSVSQLEHLFDEIVILDFPGYLGFLSAHAMVPSMEILLNVTRTVCEAYPPTVLIGHSLGGWLASKVAQTSPKLLDHLILLAPSGLIPSEIERERFGKFILSNQNLPIDELLARIMHSPKKFHEVIGENVQSFFSNAAVKDFVESVKAEHFINHQEPFSAKKLTVIWGENDQFVPSQGIREWVEYYGTYLDAYILTETAHVPQLERPFTTSEVIFHELFSKPGLEGKHWKKIQTRRQEWTNAKLAAPKNPLLTKID
jgi:pimeloyl-ACP methyl ester carboxylesterase